MPSIFRPNFLCLTLAAAVLVASTGCSSDRLIPSAGSQTAALHMQGKLHGGQQPVNGATIQLYDISSIQSPSGAAVPLLMTTVSTDANGGFNITGDYSCPAGTDQVYLVATGGDSGSGVNQDLVMMTALGNCGNLSASTFISVNEVTTVATVWAYFDDWNNQQSGGSNITTVTGSEYQNFLNLVDPATGIAQATNGANVQLELNALGNSLSPCVNSATDGTGDSMACDALISMVGASGLSATNDSAAVIYAIAANASTNTSGVYNYAPPSPPFQPTLTSAPATWNLGFAI